MPFTDQSRFRVRCEWGLPGLDTVARTADAVIIVDVLSFSTSVDVAVSRGVAILPYRWKDKSAERFAGERGALLARHRCHAGEGLSLSPSSLTQAASGARLVLPSPNGSALSLAAEAHAEHVAAGCLRNCRAAAEWASEFESVAVIPAGERWPDGSLRPAVEDLVGAGSIIRHLTGPWSPEARAAVAAFESAARDVLEFLLGSASGRELKQAGFASDVEIASRIAVSDSVPVLRCGEFIDRTAPGE